MYTEEIQRHYYAFISHSTKDERFALWLRDKLVNFKIPTSLQRDLHAPQKLSPIFLYQTDLASNTILDEAIRSELCDSRFLIVICSPDGARSPYVDKEIQHFIDSGREDHIIPLIIDGRPHSELPEEECFPPSLCELSKKGIELRGVDYKRIQSLCGSKMAPIANLIATMLGVKFDSIWDIHKRHRIRRFCILGLIAFLMCLLCAFIVDSNRHSYRYFADYVDRWGIPTGVQEIPKEVRKHLHRMYLFEYERTPLGKPNARKWRPVRVKYVDSYGNVQPEIDLHPLKRYPIQEIVYNDLNNGEILTNSFFDEHGRIVNCYQYSETANRVVLIENGKGSYFKGDFMPDKTSIQLLSPLLNTNSSRPYRIPDVSNLQPEYIHRNILCMDIERDSIGHPINIFFLDDTGPKAHRLSEGQDGLYGVVLTRDSKGRIISVRALDAYRNEQKRSEYNRDYAYHLSGNLQQMSYDTRNDTLYGGYVTKECTYGNISDIFAYTPSKENRTYSQKKYIYNDAGCLVSVPQLFQKISLTYNSKGEIHKISYGNTVIIQDYSQGRLTNVSILDSIGEPNPKGDVIGLYDAAYRVSYQYDSIGNVCLIAQYDTMQNGNHFSYSQYIIYDTNIKGHVIRNDYYYQKELTKSIVKTYDVDGHVTSETELYSGDHVVSRHEIGYSYDGTKKIREVWLSRYNTPGDTNLTYDSKRYYHVSREKGDTTYYSGGARSVIRHSTMKKNYSLFKAEFTDSYDCESYYDEDSVLFVGEKGYARKIVRYNDKRDITEISYYQSDSQLITPPEEVFAKLKIDYYTTFEDSIVEKYYYDDTNHLLKGRLAHIWLRYDKKGNLMESKCYTHNGFPYYVTQEEKKNDKGEHASNVNICYVKELAVSSYVVQARTRNDLVCCPHVLCLYNIKGLPIEWWLYGDSAQSEKSISMDSLPLISHKRIARDEQNRIIELTTFDNIEDGEQSNLQSPPRVVYVYDTMGHLTEQAFYDRKDRRMMNEDTNYSVLKWEYTDQGKIRSFSAYDTLMQRVNQSEDYSFTLWDYDDNGYLTRWTLYNKDSVVSSHKQNPICRFKYDRFGFLNRIATFNHLDSLEQSVIISYWGNISKDIVLPIYGTTIEFRRANGQLVESRYSENIGPKLEKQYISSDVATYNKHLGFLRKIASYSSAAKIEIIHNVFFHKRTTTYILYDNKNEMKQKIIVNRDYQVINNVDYLGQTPAH